MNVYVQEIAGWIVAVMQEIVEIVPQEQLVIITIAVLTSRIAAERIAALTVVEETVVLVPKDHNGNASTEYVIVQKIAPMTDVVHKTDVEVFAAVQQDLDV